MRRTAASRSVVNSVVYERGIKTFDDIFWSATKKHLSVFSGIIYPVFKIEFGNLFVNILFDVRV